MIATLSSLAALFITVLLMLLANSLLGSLLGIKLAAANEPLLTGLVMSGYYAGLVTGAMLCINIIRSVGHIRAFAAFCAANIATTLLLSLGDNVWLWVLLRFITGLSMMGSYMVVESWLNERAAPEMRGRVFSIYMVVSYAAIGSGQLLLSFSQQNGGTLFTLGAMLFALCLIPVALTRAVVPQPLEKVHFGLRHLFDLAPHAIYGCLAAGLITGAFYALGPVYALGISGDVGMVGIFMALTIFGGLSLQWPLGLLSDRVKRRLLLLALGFGLAVASLAMLLLDAMPLARMAAAALWGGLAFTLYPVAVAYANDRISAEELVPASGVLLMTYSGGAAIGPILAGLAMRTTGDNGLYLFAAIIALVLALLVARRRGAERVTVDEQGDYVAMPRTSTVITQLDPRTEEDAEESEAVS